MIDLQEYRAKFEKQCLAAGLIKLGKPVDTKEITYTAFEIRKSHAAEAFDVIFFEPSVQALIKSITTEDQREFYCLDVRCRNNIVVLTSSRGDNSAERVLLKLVK